MSGKPDIMDDRRNLLRINILEALASSVYDNVLFVDAGNGNDGYTGADFPHALQTINGAMAVLNKLYPDPRGRHYAIIFQGRLTGGNAMPSTQIINVPGVHLIGAALQYGMGGGWDSCFVTKGSLLTSNPDYSGLRTTYAGLEIQADDVLVAGLKFYGADTGNPFYHIAIDDAHGGRGCAIVNCTLQGDVNGAATINGIGFNGAETGLAKDNLYYYLKEGVTLGGGGTRYCHEVAVEHGYFQGCQRGIAAINTATENCLMELNRMIQKATYGWALTAGFDFTGSGNGHNVVNNYVGHATKANAYTPGAGTHFWSNNYYGTNVLYDGT
jgi:hypothetical protein